jgi:DNA polymerase III epsilon subunit-like protein
MLFRDTTDLAAMAEALSRSSDYRVLRRLVPRKLSAPLPGQETKTAIHLDTETTGLDFATNEIVELAWSNSTTRPMAGSSASATRSPSSTALDPDPAQGHGAHRHRR